MTMEDTISDPVAAADWAMRHWKGPGSDAVRPGSDAHKRLFCQMLLETHNPYKPAVIQWPTLDAGALHRLTSLPIWDIAVQTEGRASIRVRTFAETVTDPLLRQALDMDGGEEARHKVVLSKLVEAYGISLEPEPNYAVPRDPEWAWLVTGYSECIDSFFAFGLFAHAKQSSYFPAELVETFEPVIQEEARHILFFVNWAAWYRRNLPWWRRPVFAAKVAAVFAFLAWERIGIARGLDANGEMQDANFAVTGSATVGAEIKPAELMRLCLTENARRMQGYDARLLRPKLMPRLAAAAHWLLSKRSARKAAMNNRQETSSSHRRK
jgi:hypothetical protein